MRPILSPSLICMEPERVPAQTKALLHSGVPYIHVDLIDGRFSPGVPLTFAQLDRIAAEAEIPMDVHIMAMDNEDYVRRALAYGPKQVCFHWESAIHVDYLLRLIKAEGVRCGVALAPATPVSVLEYAAELCDFVLLMLINPGYASSGSETMVPYALRKIADCRAFLAAHGRDIPIEVDGRVSLQATPELVAAGADILVSGSTGVFSKAGTLTENIRQAEAAMEAGLKLRKER